VVEFGYSPIVYGVAVLVQVYSDLHRLLVKNGKGVIPRDEQAAKQGYSSQGSKDEMPLAITAAAEE
jgi:hypothetical protein